jgi:hypothetical protein
MDESKQGGISNLTQWVEELGHFMILENLAPEREELDTAISRIQAVVLSLANSHPQKSEWLHSLGVVLPYKAEHIGNRDEF